MFLDETVFFDEIGWIFLMKVDFGFDELVFYRRLRASRLHNQCHMFFCETARVLGCHESRNSWTLWIPRLCTKHLSAGQDRGMDR